MRTDVILGVGEKNGRRSAISAARNKQKWLTDKFYEPDSEGGYRAPFLRISHARPPTESRPGHVTIIAGFYEDPSAVTKGWKANPVEFDSVFNRNIVPIFCGALPHSTWNSYPHEFEDFATGHGSSLIFTRLCDYENDIMVHKIAEKVYNLVQDYYKDHQTAYIFTADHGMSDKELKQATSLYIKPFKPLDSYSSLLSQIEHLISLKEYETAMKLSEQLRSLALQGLHYFQTYDWLMLMTVITLGYVGWMIYVILHVMQSYTSLPANIFSKEQVPNPRSTVKVHLLGGLLMGLACSLLLVENSSPLYHAYVVMTMFLSLPMRSGIPIFVWIVCWFLSVFTLMPPQIPENTLLVVAGAVMIITTGIVLRYVELHAKDNINWLSLVVQDSSKLKSSPCSSTCRLASIFLGIAPPFLLLLIDYEAVFYGALSLALIAWILVEKAYLHITKFRSSTPIKSLEDDKRCLELSDMRIPLTFMVFFNIAFFGTGNFASIASFEISSVYRFITIFSPFLMAALLIFKLLIPFILVICAFSSITKLVQVPLLGCYFLVILCSDVMTIHFFFLVRNKGSWMEIGNSISHFGIMSAQVVFVLMLFAVTNVFIKDIQVRSAQQFSHKKK
ncbi:unnamed protein product [Withania somnifera]